MKNIFHKALLAFSMVFSGLLLVAYTAPHINPEVFWLPAFVGLAYPYLLLVNVILTVYWMLRRRWSFLIPLVVILLGYGHVQDFFQISKPGADKNEYSSMKLMTYNVRAFDKYGWTKNKKTPNNIVELLKQNRADIYCFQEFYSTKTGLLSLHNLKKATACKYLFVGKNQNCVLFSRYPIIKKGEIKFEENNRCNAIYADIKKGDKIVRVYNLHLESNRMVSSNYDFINKKEFKADEQELEEIKDISFRLRRAFIHRAKQAGIIRNHIEKSPYPTIVCGDFNDTAHSYVYHKIKGDFTDCFREKGLGIGTTYSGDFPSFRIDFIMHDDKTVCYNYKRIKKRYSDHFPVFAKLNFVEN